MSRMLLNWWMMVLLLWLLPFLLLLLLARLLARDQYGMQHWQSLLDPLRVSFLARVLFYRTVCQHMVPSHAHSLHHEGDLGDDDHLCHILLLLHDNTHCHFGLEYLVVISQWGSILVCIPVARCLAVALENKGLLFEKDYCKDFGVEMAFEQDMDSVGMALDTALDTAWEV